MRDFTGGLFADVFERSANPMAVIGSDGTVLRLNPAACRLLSLTEAGVRPLADFVAESARYLVEDFLQKAFEGRMIDHERLPVIGGDGVVQLVRAESSLHREDGEDVLLLEFSPEAGIERGIAGLELFRHAVEAANDAIIITTPELDAPHPMMEYVNPAFSRMTGWQAHEVIGQTPRILQGPLTDHHLLHQFRDDLTLRSHFHGETANYRKDGSVYYVEWRVSALRGADGNVTHWVAIQRDVSERKAREREYQALYEELEYRVTERTRELEELNRELQSFSYTVSHDLRAPLRAVLGFSRALREDYEDRLDDEGRDYLERMSGAAKRMDELITAILGLSRLSRAELSIVDCDVTAAALNVGEDLRTAYPRVRFDVAEGLRLRGDAGLLRVGLHNLLENAAKFSKPEGEPVVTVREETRDRRRYIVVEDQGIGFEQSKAATIFQPFERLYGGTGVSGSGIGLATVDRLVKRHGGRVFAESEVEKGARFFFTLEPT